MNQRKLTDSLKQSTLTLEDKRISYYGSKRDIEKAKRIIGGHYTQEMSEPEARLLIQRLIDNHKLKAGISINGNGVWSYDRIIRNIRQIKKHGTLYKKDKTGFIPIGSLLRMPVIGETWLTKYTYKFLHLCCGSIAHYNIHGWVATYPTLEDLKQFFKKNEFGKRVLDDVPGWKKDVLVIVRSIEHILGLTEDDFPRNPFPWLPRKYSTEEDLAFIEKVKTLDPGLYEEMTQ